MSLRFIKITMLIFILSITLVPETVNAQSAIPTKEEDIKKLLKASGADESLIKVTDYITETALEQLREDNPSVDDNTLELARQKSEAIAYAKFDDFYNMMVPVYSLIFSHDEVRDIIAFLETPTGKKFVESNGNINSAFQQNSTIWGTTISADMYNSAKAEVEKKIPAAKKQPEPKIEKTKTQKKKK